MATENVIYIDYAEAVNLHFELMELWGETRFGVDFRDLLDSALARSGNAAIYENADIIRQAALLWAYQKSSLDGRAETNALQVF